MVKNLKVHNEGIRTGSGLCPSFSGGWRSRRDFAAYRQPPASARSAPSGDEPLSSRSSYRLEPSEDRPHFSQARHGSLAVADDHPECDQTDGEIAEARTSSSAAATTESPSTPTISMRSTFISLLWQLEHLRGASPREPDYPPATPPPCSRPIPSPGPADPRCSPPVSPGAGPISECCSASWLLSSSSESKDCPQTEQVLLVVVVSMSSPTGAPPSLWPNQRSSLLSSIPTPTSANRFL